MRIYNYDFDRAEHQMLLNDNKVAKLKKREHIGRILQLLCLVVMLLGIIAMAICTILVLMEYNQEPNALLFGSVMSAVTCLFAFVVFWLIRDFYKKTRYPIEKTEFDNVETQYHRLLQKYTKVEPRVVNNVVVCLCYDDERMVCGYELRPACIRKAERNTMPVYDLQYNCLWIP